MSKKTIISSLDDTILELKALAKEKEDIRHELAVTAEQLAITAKEKEDIRLKLAVTAEELRLKAEDLAVTAKENENAKIAARNVLEDLLVEKEKIAEVNAKDEALLESIGDGVVAIDQNGFTILLNKSATKMLGYKNEDVIGKKWHDVVRNENDLGTPTPLTERPLSVVLKTGTIITNSECYFVRKDGTRFPTALNVTPIKLDTKIIGAMEVFRDITKEKELEKAKSEFISIATHQLKTPVAGLKWIFESLRIPPEQLDDKQKQYLKDISGFLGSLSRTMEDLLNVTRADLGTLNIDFQSVNFRDFIGKFIDEMTPYAKSQKHSIVLSGTYDASLNISVDAKILYGVFQNLVSNAIEYSPAEAAVTIDINKENENLKISVINKGPAISKEAKSHIFEKFYRAPEAKRVKAGGTGIGLYIVKTFVEKLGGKVGFESEEGKDTFFWFTIPIETKLTNQK